MMRRHGTRRVQRGGRIASPWGWIVVCLVLSAGTWASTAAQEVIQPSPEAQAGALVIHPVLQRSLEGSPADAELVVWVLFRDKGLTSSQEAAALEELGRTMSKNVLLRRSRVRGVPMVDARDLPVHEPYLQAVQSLGAELRQRTRWLNGGSFDLTVGQLREVAQLPFIRELVPVARGRVDDSRAVEVVPLGDEAGEVDPDNGLEYGPSYGQLAELNVPAAHEAGFSGAGVQVMMLDTGFFKDHEVFENTILLSEWDYVFGDGNVQNEPEDDDSAHNHGTASWSVCGGFKSGTLIGPAYGASFHLAKTEDIRSETQAEEDNYVAALERADSLGVWVTSASLSYLEFDDGEGYEYPDLDGDTAVITRAVDIAASKGILCANSMGNAGPEPGSLWTPADADTMLAAGAVDSLGEITSFSSRGPTFDGRIKPELVARGLDVYLASAPSGGYTHGGGTSFSCPLLSGCATLVLEAHPEWGPVEALEALKMSADNSDSPDNDYGWGRPDVYDAIFSQTPIFPLPFSLCSPPDGMEPPLPVRLVWQSSEDLDSGIAPLYTVVIQEAGSDDPPFVHEGIADTSYLPPDPLSPGTEYEWKVFAVDEDGHERQSRRTRTFIMPSGASVGDPVAVVSGPGLVVWPNPSSGGVSMRLAGTAGAGERLRVTVFSPSGRQLLSRDLNSFSWMWDGRDAVGRPVPSGIYWIRLTERGRRLAEARWVKLR